jgi:NAD(P)H-hydrate repair Nnr-like enzyme with NAD(P)H-hydrate dehydratase domain
MCPELMFRQVDVLASQVLPSGIWVCGCGGGQAVIPYLPVLLRQATVLVLDADALNAIASDVSLQQLLQIRATSKFVTVLTPHPLEAARLLQTTASLVQQDRLSTAATLANRFKCICVLKGSGTVTAAPDCVPTINPTGNAKLSTAGTGDVLAGMLGAALARHTAELKRAPQADVASDSTHAVLSGYVSVVCGVVYSHGQVADRWPVTTHLSASQLAFAAGTQPTEN